MAESPVEITDQTCAQGIVSKPANEDGRGAQAFLERHGCNLHPALDPRASLRQDETKEKDGPYPYIFKGSLDRHTWEFIQFVEAYRDEWQDPRVRALSLRGKVSWDQVMQEVRKAEDRYQLVGGKVLRKLARKATDQSPVVIPFMRMLPDNNMWLPAVGGALRIIFEVFGNISKNLEHILKFLVRIPDIIIQTEDTRVNFGPDPALYVKAEKVCIAVLAAIEGTVKWLNKRVTGKAFAAIKFGPS